MRSCGKCHACCSAFHIPELNKPRGEVCKHLTPEGCAIYTSPDKPPRCSAFVCCWLKEELGLPESYRPDRVGLILHCDKARTVLQVVACGNWQSEQLSAVQRHAFRDGFKLVRMTPAPGVQIDCWQDGWAYQTETEPGGRIHVRYLFPKPVDDIQKAKIREETQRRLASLSTEGK